MGHGISVFQGRINIGAAGYGREVNWNAHSGFSYASDILIVRLQEELICKAGMDFS
jgi:hypothetical protein